MLNLDIRRDIVAFLKLAWLWLKKHWYVPFIFIGAVAIAAISSSKSRSLYSMLLSATDSYQNEREKMKELQTTKEKQKQELSLHYEKIFNALDEKLRDEEIFIANSTRERVSELAEQYKEEPEKFNEALEREFSVKLDML